MLRNRCRVYALIVLAMIMSNQRSHAQLWDSDEGDPQDRCAECHGLDGAGNHIKFPRLAGQKRAYIVKQLHDFREGKRTNDGGQMQKTATEIKEADIPRVAKWFEDQNPRWPKLTINAKVDLDRARTLALKGADGLKACLSCHSAAPFAFMDGPTIAPRIAGQRDFYLAKELRDYRAGLRRKNDVDHIMTKIARRLSDDEIIGLAVYLSQNPQLHDELVP